MNGLAGPGLAGLFPGQLSEKAGMGEALARSRPWVAELFDEVAARSGVDLAATFFGEGSPRLHDDLPAQVGVFAVSVAVLEVLKREFDVRPAAVAGYSLGTYAAFVAAGVLEKWEALEVLLEAERLLAAEQAGGAMGFVIGMTREAVAALVRAVSQDEEVLAIGNENAAQQFVLTGETRAVTEAIARAQETALKAQLLPLAWPMHSPRLVPVAERLESFVRLHVAVHEPWRATLYAPMLGRRVADASEAALVLARQISRPALWDGILRAMADDGYTRFAEIGPGDVLTRLLRWTLREATGAVAEDPESIARVAGASR